MYQVGKKRALTCSRLLSRLLSLTRYHQDLDFLLRWRTESHTFLDVWAEFTPTLEVARLTNDAFVL